MFGCPGMLRSLDTLKRPALSSSAPGHLPTEEPRTPAIQTTVFVGRYSSAIMTPCSSTALTAAFVLTSTPSWVSAAQAFFASVSENVGSILGPASTRRTRADAGSIWRKSDTKALCASSATAPVISTPAGPAPTITNVNSAWRFSGSFSCSAASKESRILCRIAVAS